MIIKLNIVKALRPVPPIRMFYAVEAVVLFSAANAKLWAASAPPTLAVGGRSVEHSLVQLTRILRRLFSAGNDKLWRVLAPPTHRQAPLWRSFWRG